MRVTHITTLLLTFSCSISGHDDELMGRRSLGGPICDVHEAHQQGVRTALHPLTKDAISTARLELAKYGISPPDGFFVLRQVLVGTRVAIESDRLKHPGTPILDIFAELDSFKLLRDSSSVQSLHPPVRHE